MDFYIDDFNKVVCSANISGDMILKYNNKRIEIKFSDGICVLDEVIILRTKYFIEYNENIYQLIYRGICHSEEFEKITKYEGNLGVYYTRRYTEFRIFAPTAYNLWVKFVDTNELFKCNINNNGVYYLKVIGDFELRPYKLVVEHENIIETLDPYAISSHINSLYNYIIDTKKIKKINILRSNKEQSIIYECSIRDFSSDINSNFEYKGLYKGFTESGILNNKSEEVGFDYLKKLGITNIQLMPIFDFGSTNELNQNEYNWGYDPVQYLCPEGSYATDPKDPYNRINELVELVNSCHKQNIAVNMDVVFNHVYRSEDFSFANLVPYYYFRYDESYNLLNSTYCGNEVATERFMVCKFITDILRYLTKTFGFSGYRFDLMGVHNIAFMNTMQNSLPEYIHLYGEGWLLDTHYDNNELAIQRNHYKISNIGFFNDYFRENIKRLAAGHYIDNRDYIIKRCLMADEYSNIYQSINYVSCHDGYTIYDTFLYDLKVEDIKKSIKLAYIFVLLSRGIPFLHLGCEMLRTKKGVKNSYNSPGDINMIDWNNKDNELIEFVCQLIYVRKLINVNKANKYDVNIENNLITITIDDNFIIYINVGDTDINIMKKGREIISGEYAMNFNVAPQLYIVLDINVSK